MRFKPHALILALGASLAAATAANAGDVHYGGYGYGGYGAGYDGYGFAGPAINGAYIGAPFTRIPRPAQLVPPAWGFGTYGIPTATGIVQAPSAQPLVFVVNGGRRGLRPASRGSRILSRDGGRWTDEVEGTQAAAHGAQVVPLSAR